VQPESFRPHVENWKNCGLDSADSRALSAVAGEAQRYGVLSRARGFRVPPAMASHTGLVSRRQRRQAIAEFVTAAALALGGPHGVKCPWIGNAPLGMRIVAVTAALIVLIGLQRLPAMAPGPQLRED